MAEPVLKKGSKDPAVRDLQEALRALGYDLGAVDGVFGANTENAVKQFQQAREIPVDGVVGRVTWINIDEADQSHPADSGVAHARAGNRVEQLIDQGLRCLPIDIDAENMHDGAGEYPGRESAGGAVTRPTDVRCCWHDRHS